MNNSRAGFVGHTYFRWFQYLFETRSPRVAWWRPVATKPVPLDAGAHFFFFVHSEEPRKGHASTRLIKAWGIMEGQDCGTPEQLWAKYGDILGAPDLKTLKMTLEHVSSEVPSSRPPAGVYPVNLLNGVQWPDLRQLKKAGFPRYPNFGTEWPGQEMAGFWVTAAEVQTILEHFKP